MCFAHIGCTAVVWPVVPLADRLVGPTSELDDSTAEAPRRRFAAPKDRQQDPSPGTAQPPGVIFGGSLRDQSGEQSGAKVGSLNNPGRSAADSAPPARAGARHAGKRAGQPAPATKGSRKRIICAFYALFNYPGAAVGRSPTARCCPDPRHADRIARPFLISQDKGRYDRPDAIEPTIEGAQRG